MFYWQIGEKVPVIRLSGMHFTLEWEKPVNAVTEYFDLHNVTLIGASFGGFLAPRASAFAPRVEKVSLEG